MYDSLNMHSLESSLIDIMRAEQDPMKSKTAFPFLSTLWVGGGGPDTARATRRGEATGPFAPRAALFFHTPAYFLPPLRSDLRAVNKPLMVARCFLTEGAGAYHTQKRSEATHNPVLLLNYSSRLQRRVVARRRARPPGARLPDIRGAVSNDCGGLLDCSRLVYSPTRRLPPPL